MRTLSSQLQKFDKDIKQRVNRYKIQFAKTILLKLIDATPADTSKALSNWIVGLTHAKGKVITPYAYGMDGNTRWQSSAMAYSIGHRVIERAKVGEIVYITNSVDYIELLNMGYSPQADEYYIQECVESSAEQMKRVKL